MKSIKLILWLSLSGMLWFVWCFVATMTGIQLLVIATNILFLKIPNEWWMLPTLVTSSGLILWLAAFLILSFSRWLHKLLKVVHA